MKHLDLFSGIGGFALAARWAGIETVAFCEIEDFPRKVLAKNFPGVPIHRDIRELNGSDYAAVDLITGGYPCQPFSLAGKRKGTEDDRHLWPEMRRVIAQARPAWIVAENVTGHITLGLDQVLTELECEGYAARAIVVPACATGAPHRRDRVWIIAHAKGERLQRRDKLNGYGESGGKGIRPEPAGVCGGKIWLWSSKPTVVRGTNGLPNRVDRIRSLGNAIVPQVAYQILRAISAA